MTRAAPTRHPARGTPDAESDRIRRAYSGYAADDAVRRRWNPDSPGNRAIHAERAEVLREMLVADGRVPFTSLDVLEVGCGSGEVLASLTALGARPERMHGVDLRPDAVADARRAFPAMRWHCANAESVTLPSASFDVLLAFTVFSSILDASMSRSLAAEIGRLLRPGGSLVWYDFRFASPYNPNVRGMKAAAIRALFPGWPATLRSVTVLPPLARALGAAAPTLYPLLARVSLLRTHWLGVLRRPGTATDRAS